MEALITTLLNWVEITALSVVSLLMVVVLFYKQHHGKLFRLVYSAFIVLVLAWVFILVVTQPPLHPRPDDLIRPIACVCWMAATIIRVRHLLRQAKADEMEKTALAFDIADVRLFSLTLEKLQKFSLIGLGSIFLAGLLVAKINRVELLQFTTIAANQQTKTVVAQANQRLAAVERQIGDDTAVTLLLNNQMALERKFDKLVETRKTEPVVKRQVRAPRVPVLKPLESKTIVVPPISNTIVPGPVPAEEKKRKRWYWPPDWFSARADSANQLIVDYKPLY